MRPWSPIPIEDCGEPLQALPPALLRMEPHPYMALGAPYGTSGNPFQLRLGVVQRLLDAQQQLVEHDPRLRLSIFDAWRPIAVQAFMVDHSIVELCRERGVEVRSGHAFEQVVADVLVQRSLRCAEDHGVQQLVMVGGVAANRRLRQSMLEQGKQRGITVSIAPPGLLHRQRRHDRSSGLAASGPEHGMHLS